MHGQCTESAQTMHGQCTERTDSAPTVHGQRTNSARTVHKEDRQDRHKAKKWARWEFLLYIIHGPPNCMHQAGVKLLVVSYMMCKRACSDSCCQFFGYFFTSLHFLTKALLKHHFHLIMTNKPQEFRLPTNSLWVSRFYKSQCWINAHMYAFKLLLQTTSQHFDITSCSMHLIGLMVWNPYLLNNLSLLHLSQFKYLLHNVE